MGLLEKTIGYDAADVSFIGEHYNDNNALPDILAYLLANEKTFAGIVDIEPTWLYSFLLFSVEKITFPVEVNSDAFSFRLGVFLEKGGKIIHVASGIKQLGYIIPSTFVINGAEIKNHGLYNLHAFAFPENHHARLPADFSVELHLEASIARPKR